MDAATIIQRLREKAAAIFDDGPVDVAYLYGSVAEGRLHPFSDVDIALVLDETALRSLSPLERLELELKLEMAIEDLCDISNADVRVINDAPLVFRGQVACNGIRLYSRNAERRIEFETATWDEYFDFQPTLRMMRQAFFDRLRKEGLRGSTGKAEGDVRESKEICQ